MKLEKKIARLLEDHELSVIIEQLTSQAGLPRILVQVSNRLIFRGDKDQANQKKWTKRAKVVHNVMEEIVNDEASQQAQA